MIDYLHEMVALDAFTAKLSATLFTDVASRNAQKQTLDDLNSETGSALLGTLLQHLIAHSASNGLEITLLQRASRLWAGGRDLCTELGKVRADFENALESPGDPLAADRFNNAAITIHGVSNTATAMLAEIDSLRKDVMTFKHLLPHPRQHDLATHSWDWSNLTLGRRTDALVRNLFRAASSKGMTAFATGAVSSYGANVVGSAYLGHAVGGPRRSHRFRDRLARNAVGNWLASHHPGIPSPAKLADRITFGSHAHPQLPSELQSLLQDALTTTFDLAETEALPDLKIGYSRLVTHLRLLDSFSRPDVPTTPTQFWMAALYGDPQNIQSSLRPQDVDVNAQDGGGATATYGPPAPGSSTPDSSDSSKTASGCGIALLLIVLVDLVQAFVQCIGQWANKHRCTFWDNMLLKKAWEQDPPDPRDSTRPENPNVTASRLTAIAGSPQAISLVGQMFNVHGQAWRQWMQPMCSWLSRGFCTPSICSKPRRMRSSPHCLRLFFGRIEKMRTPKEPITCIQPHHWRIRSRSSLLLEQERIRALCCLPRQAISSTEHWCLWRCGVRSPRENKTVRIGISMRIGVWRTPAGLQKVPSTTIQ